MSQELINWLHGLYIETGYNEAQQAADAIQYLLDGADEVNQALREQIEANERLTAENERLSRPTLSQLRRERIQLMGENEKLKAENARLTVDIDILMHAVEGDCAYCSHNGEWGDESPCWHCEEYAAREFVTGNYWQWRGVKQEETE